MPRPRKRRKLGRAPCVEIYKPAGVPLNNLRQVPLEPDELEAIRLADLRGLTQEQGALEMEISRSTFQRTVTRARRQVAMALVEGAALRLVGCVPDQDTNVDHERKGKS